MTRGPDLRSQALGHTKAVSASRGASALLAAKLSVLNQFLVRFWILEMEPLVHEITEMFIVLWVVAIVLVSHCFFNHRLVFHIPAIAVVVEATHMSYADRPNGVPS